MVCRDVSGYSVVSTFLNSDHPMHPDRSPTWCHKDSAIFWYMQGFIGAKIYPILTLSASLQGTRQLHIYIVFDALKRTSQTWRVIHSRGLYIYCCELWHWSVLCDLLALPCLAPLYLVSLVVSLFPRCFDYKFLAVPFLMDNFWESLVPRYLIHFIGSSWYVPLPSC